MFYSKNLLLFSIVILSSGCANNDVVMKRLSESEAKIELLIQTNRRYEQSLNEFSAQIAAVSDKNRQNDAKQNALSESLKSLQNRSDEITGKIELLAKRAATPKIELVNPSPAKTSESGPPQDYLKAFGLYSANNFVEAIKAFESFIKSAPESEYAANALYWIGECHYSLSELPKAKEIFLKVAGTYPNSLKAPDAMLKLGYTLIALKEKEKANSIFENLIKAYPGSAAASKAREKLSGI